MTVYVKSGGAWRAATNGRLWIKNGGQWRLANYCYIKSGGAWRDSGYRGYPLPPSNLRISSWPEFSSVTVTFSGPGAGGAPVDHYEVVMTNSNLNPDVGWPNTNAGGNIIDYNNANTSGSQTFGVAADYRVGFFVRSVTASGLKSAWVAGERAQIGHPEQGHNVSVQNTQGWYGANDFSGTGLHRGEVAYIVVPAGVYMTQWTHSYKLSFPGTYLSKPPAQGNRQIYYYNTQNGGSGVPWDINIAANSTYTWTEAISNVAGQGLGWGIYIDGLGWTAAPGSAQILIGSIALNGFSYYYTNQWVVDVAHVGNSYW